MPSAERRAHEAKKDAEASAKRHAKGLPASKDASRALLLRIDLLIKLHLFQIARGQGQCHVLEG
jgi:hypothetical protein